jgi:hypothetical protein
MLLALPLAQCCWASESVFDRVEEALTWSSPAGTERARLSGTLDLELTQTPVPAPGLLPAETETLFVPRLTTYLDAQWGSHVYFFAQGRADRGFDAEAGHAQFRLDEYAVRLTPWVERRFSIQAGKFGTVVGNWVARHESWPNPLISAPLPYENLTGVWDNEAIRFPGVLLQWSHVRAGLPAVITRQEKNFRIPIIWGPVYSLGLAAAGEAGRLRYAFELKNSSLSSRPGEWNETADHWSHPTVSGRISYRFNELWNLGFSTSVGPYLRAESRAPLPLGRGLGDYRQIVVAQDASFAWHRLQLWSEIFFGRFEIPGVGNADSVAYYVEAKYKFTPQFFVAGRWNEHRFGRIRDRSGFVTWGQDTWRAEIAPGFRLSPHSQLKLQMTLMPGSGQARFEKIVATQFTTRF